MPFRKIIRDMIQKAGLAIIRHHEVSLTPEVLEQLYPGLDPEIMAVTKQALLDKVCEIGLIRGDDAIARLLEICGKNVDPKQCAHNTIRNLFGRRTPIRNNSGTIVYYFNIIHRPKNKSEAERDLAIYVAITPLSL